MNQSASRTFLAAFSCIAKKQPNICIEAIICPLLQQKQFGELRIVEIEYHNIKLLDKQFDC